MLSGDPDDDWSRFLKQLRENRRDLIEQVIGGACDPKTYNTLCGQIIAINNALALAVTVRRGEDINPPQRREKLRSPEC